MEKYRLKILNGFTPVSYTHLDVYKRQDAALERRFQPVMVDEPTVEDTISILRGLKERYEVFHLSLIHI